MVSPDGGGTPPDRTPPAVAVTGLTKVYGDEVLAVDDISFAVAPGDFCVVIGPSGCGKSTTLHSLVGTVEVTAGRIEIDGLDVTDTPTYDRDIGLVFQDFQLFPHLTVEENVRYGVEGTDREIPDGVVRETMELMRLLAVRDRAPASLSAGQKQRVALARSLVLRPKVLLLDEPLGDMDYKLQKRMERELLRVHRELDTTFVYVTHDQTQAMRLADQIVVMNDGKIEQSGTVDEVYNRPATAFVAAFVGDSNIFSGTVAGGDGETVDVETPFGPVTCDADPLPTPVAELRGKTVSVVVRPQHLELGDGNRNALDCEVRDVLYQPGAGTQVVLDATGDDGATRRLQLLSTERLDLTADDGPITVSWSPSNALPLERTSVVAGTDLQRDILGE